MCPDNKRSTHRFSKVDEIEILFITGIKEERNYKLDSELFYSVNVLSQELSREDLVKLTSEKIINHIKESYEDVTILKSNPLGYILFMDTINNYEENVVKGLNDYLLDKIDNYDIKTIFLEASIIAKDNIWTNGK